MKSKLLLCCCFVALFICSNVFAKVVYLNNGSKAVGKIVSQDDDKIVLEIGEGEDATDVTFFSDEIKSMEETDLEANAQSEVNLEEETLVESAQPDQTQQPGVLVIDKQMEITQPVQVPPVETKIEPQNTQQENKPQSLEQPPQQEISEEGQHTLEQLTSLLDEEELAYFANINSMSGDVVNKTTQILNNPNALAADPTQLPQMMQDLSSDIANIVTQMNSIKAPTLFVNFHKDYLTNLNLLKDVLAGMSKGDVNSSQTNISEMQNMSIKLQSDLQEILQKKKTKAQGEESDASN